MPLKSYNIKLDKNEVMGVLGYGDIENVPEKTAALIDKLIDEAYKLIEPKIFYKKVPFKIDDNNKGLILEGGKVLSGNYIYENLKDCDYIIAVIATIGSRISIESTLAFEKQDYLEGYAYDTIGVCALNVLNKMFWLDTIDNIMDESCGITKKICPGIKDWDISGQGMIYEILSDVVEGIKINESFMLDPVKSDSMIYGVGKNIGISKDFHDCNDCSLIECQYRPSDETKFNIRVVQSREIKNITAAKGERLYTALARNGIYALNFCGGNHKCGKCRVIVKSEIHSPSDDEKKLLKSQNAGRNERLSCFIEIYEDLEIEIPEACRKSNIIVDGIIKDIKLNPVVKSLYVKLNKPEIGRQRDDFSRLKDSAGCDEYKLSYSALLKLPEAVYNENGQVSCAIIDNEILDINDGSDPSILYGIGVDIGTTTIAAYLLNLNTGKQIDVYSSLNPQRVYGADVISRINHTMVNPQGISELKKLIIDELNRIIDIFCERNCIGKNSIYVMSFAGNTIMLHMLLGINAANIANAPFIPVFTDSIKIKALEIGININIEGYIFTIPCLSGYIGADTIAAVLACNMAEDDDVCLLLDIGTNGEIVLGNKDRMVCCSSAAGPAFEGANITFGTGGIEGAIDHVDLCSEPVYSTIYGKPPIGICGSGIIDSLSELLKFGVIDETGKMLGKNEAQSDFDKRFLSRLKEYNGMPAFLIDGEKGIYITQRDIREIQLAKAAIYGGIMVLINELGIHVEDIKKLYLAGGFGNYLNIESAAKAGIFPGELIDRVIPVGNAAGAGAKAVLADEDSFSVTSCIKNKMDYIELSCSLEFQNEYIEAMSFIL